MERFVISSNPHSGRQSHLCTLLVGACSRYSDTYRRAAVPFTNECAITKLGMQSLSLFYQHDVKHEVTVRDILNN